MIRTTLERVAIATMLLLPACNKPGGASSVTNLAETESPTPKSVTTAATTAKAAAACTHLNESDLGAVANCYYHGASADTWRLLSKGAQAENDKNKWIAAKDVSRTLSIKVLGEQSHDSQTYGLVEVEEAGDNCKETRTHTWRQEDGAWRRESRPKTGELVNRQFSNGDYSAAANTAEKWLEDDPFSVDAYGQLIFALARGGRASHTPRDVNDIIRASLAVNPTDSTVLVTAVTFTKNVDMAEVLFDRIATDDCGRVSAAFNLACNMEPRRRIKFLERVGSTDPKLTMVLIGALRELHDKKRLAAILTVEAEKSFKKDLEEKDGSHAAAWSSTLGQAQLLLGNVVGAKAWASYGATRDPNSVEIARLLRKLKR